MTEAESLMALHKSLMGYATWLCGTHITHIRGWHTIMMILAKVMNELMPCP